MTIEKFPMALKEKNINKLVNIADILKTIAHPTRLEIIELLDKNKSMTVSEIAIQVKIEQSLLSHHLNRMKKSGILQSARSGKNIYYSIRLTNIEKIFDCVENCEF